MFLFVLNCLKGNYTMEERSHLFLQDNNMVNLKSLKISNDKSSALFINNNKLYLADIGKYPIAKKEIGGNVLSCEFANNFLDVVYVTGDHKIKQFSRSSGKTKEFGVFNFRGDIDIFCNNSFTIMGVVCSYGRKEASVDFYKIPDFNLIKSYEFENSIPIANAFIDDKTAVVSNGIDKSQHIFTFNNNSCVAHKKESDFIVLSYLYSKNSPIFSILFWDTINIPYSIAIFDSIKFEKIKSVRLPANKSCFSISERFKKIAVCIKPTTYKEPSILIVYSFSLDIIKKYEIYSDTIVDGLVFLDNENKFLLITRSGEVILKDQ